MQAELRHTNAPQNIPALVVYVDDLVPELAYVLAKDHAGRWTLSAHYLDVMPNLTDPSVAQPIVVDAAGDLRRLAYPGVTTTISSVTDEQAAAMIAATEACELCGKPLDTHPRNTEADQLVCP